MLGFPACCWYSLTASCLVPLLHANHINRWVHRPKGWFSHGTTSKDLKLHSSQWNSWWTVNDCWWPMPGRVQHLVTDSQSLKKSILWNCEGVIICHTWCLHQPQQSKTCFLAKIDLPPCLINPVAKDDVGSVSVSIETTSDSNNGFHACAQVGFMQCKREHSQCSCQCWMHWHHP